jgi:hypothetical protein
MSLADSIYAHLAARPILAGIVGDSIFHIATERQSPPAAIYFETLGEDQIRPFVMSPVLASARVSFECWADDVSGGSATAEIIARDVYMAFMDPNDDGAGGATGNLGGGEYIQDIRFESSRAMYDEAARQYGRELDFTFDYRL